MATITQEIIKFKQYRPDKILQIVRIPRVRIIRTHLLGITLGLFLATAILVVAYPSFDTIPKITMIIAFALGSYYNMLFLLIVIFAVTGVVNPSSEFFQVFRLLATWYLVAYLFAIVYGISYNILVFVGRTFRIEITKSFLPKIGRNKRFKRAFAYDPSAEFNIIKSPIEAEERAFGAKLRTLPFLLNSIRMNLSDTDTTVQEEVDSQIDEVISYVLQVLRTSADEDKARILVILDDILKTELKEDFWKHVQQLEEFQKKLCSVLKNDKTHDRAASLILQDLDPLLETYLRLRQRKYYNYAIKTAPDHPYTIAFVANPCLPKQGENSRPEMDPIFGDLLLFLKTVDKALRSFESNEIVGKPEIWSRTRVVTLFPHQQVKTPSDDFCFVQGGSGESDEGPISNLLLPQDNVWQNRIRPALEKSLEELEQAEQYPKTLLDEIDVVYILSASEKYTRSYALPADFPAPASAEAKKLLSIGIPFDVSFASNRELLKEKYGNPDLMIYPNVGTGVHEYYSSIPGIVAMNALSATRKTVVHEFAHAMSSTVNGAIVDEYTDEFFLDSANPSQGMRSTVNFNINRLERNHGRGLVPVLYKFLDYDSMDFLSDLDHPSARENWRGIFPERFNKNIPCTMDRSGRAHRFDKLLTVFIYERLVAKINRPSKG